MKISVLSDGAWGTALATVLISNNHDVTMWGPFPEYIEEMAQSRFNSKFLPGVRLDDRLKFEADMALPNICGASLKNSNPFSMLTNI